MNSRRYAGLSKLVACTSLGLLSAGSPARAETAKVPGLDKIADLRLMATRAEAVSYRGQQALQLLPLAGHENEDGSMLAILPSSEFKDGTIELDVAGAPRPGAAANMRGFIGLAFHVQPGAEKFECLYIRPSNARAEDQLVRNHSVQYVESPDFPWQKLRQESPGAYEAYVDMEVGAWTHLKVEVSGKKARLYVNGAKEPTLIVNDLKLGEVRGAIALWAHTTTLAYFANLHVH